MHLAAAAGVRVTAVFGPTNERATRPLGDRHVVLTHPVWCRPCMLRECPIDHGCMRGVEPSVVLDARAQDAVTSAAPSRRPAVFLDRDGTIIEEVGYLDAIDRIAFFPWTVDAIRSLNRAGLPVVVITNQSGIAREKFTEAFVNETHRAPLVAARSWRCAHRRVLLLSAPSGRDHRRVRQGLRVPQAGNGFGRARRPRPRPGSRALVHGGGPLARRRAWTGDGRPGDSRPHRRRRTRGKIEPGGRRG